MLKRYLVSLIFVFCNLGAMQREIHHQFRDFGNFPTVAAVTQQASSTEAISPDILAFKLKAQLIALSNCKRRLQQLGVAKSDSEMLNFTEALEYNTELMSEPKTYSTYRELMSMGNQVYSTYLQLMHTLFIQSRKKGSIWCDDWIAQNLDIWMQNHIADQMLLITILEARK